MSRGRLDALQWFGLLAAPLAWAAQLVVGFFLTEARCGEARWRAGWSPAIGTITLIAAAVAVLAEGAAACVFLALRGVAGDAPGPRGRQRFFAIGGLVGNVIFFVAILLSGVTVIAAEGCRPA